MILSLVATCKFILFYFTYLHTDILILLDIPVVVQRYEIRLFDEFVLRGNIAVLRCPIPSSVSDYVKVISWERIDGFMITPSTGNGKI